MPKGEESQPDCALAAHFSAPRSGHIVAGWMAQAAARPPALGEASAAESASSTVLATYGAAGADHRVCLIATLPSLDGMLVCLALLSHADRAGAALPRQLRK